jgi:hypothetical protein
LEEEIREIVVVDWRGTRQDGGNVIRLESSIC